jgi:hypothetical protein
MTEPAKFDRKKTPAVMLIDKQWPIPAAAIEQCDPIWDEMQEINRILVKQNEAQEESDPDTETLLDPDAAAQDKKAAFAREVMKRGQAFMERRYTLSREDFGKVREIVYAGLTWAHPELTLPEFMGWKVPFTQLLLAFLVVRKQSGMFGDFEGAEDEILGEALAAKRAGMSPNQTGNAS